MTANYATSALVVNERSEILAIWHERFKGWMLPGGKNEPGDEGSLDHIGNTVARELFEETGVKSIVQEQIYSSESVLVPGMHVYTFRILEWEGKAYSKEGQSVAWLAPAHFLSVSPARVAYTKMLIDVVMKKGI